MMTSFMMQHRTHIILKRYIKTIVNIHMYIMLFVNTYSNIGEYISSQRPVSLDIPTSSYLFLNPGRTHHPLKTFSLDKPRLSCRYTDNMKHKSNQYFWGLRCTQECTLNLLFIKFNYINSQNHNHTIT